MRSRSIRRRLAEQNHVEVRYCEADLVDPAQIRRLVAFATEAFGQVDILVNNAGVQHVAPIVEFPDDRWDHVLAVNLSAVFHCTKEVLPGMLARDWGRVINIASAHGLVASINKAAYVASKHGVVGLTKVAAPRDGRDRRHGQRHRPRLGPHAPGRGPDPGAGRGRGQVVRAGQASSCSPRSSPRGSS